MKVKEFYDRLGIICDRFGMSISKKSLKDFFNEVAIFGYRQAKDGFILPGFGKLTVKLREERMGRNPKTGETIRIPAKYVVKFRVSKACKEGILENMPKIEVKKNKGKVKTDKKFLK